MCASRADLLAYLHEHEHEHAFDAEDWLDRIREAVETLDLIVFVPIELGIDRIRPLLVPEGM